MKGSMEDSSDGHLVTKAKQGDAEAFAELARRCQEKIYFTILALTKNQQDASDLAQEAFMQAFKSLRSFKQRSSFYTWIYRIAVNLTLNFLKRRKREDTQEVLEESQSSGNGTEDSCLLPEGRSLKKELSEKLQSAIDSLPLTYRASFTLVVFQGMTHSQVARILGCSENTVSWRMHKARKMLQARLKPYLEGGIK
jgi:RNA polymerase sigma-70 factor (ECF subfamily)